MLSYVSDSEFESRVLDNVLPVLVVFVASWCWVCEAFREDLLVFREEHEGSIDVVLVDIDENQDTKRYYGVSGTPTSILFSSGQELAQLDGAWPPPRIAAFVHTALQSNEHSQ